MTHKVAVANQRPPIPKGMHVQLASLMQRCWESDPVQNFSKLSSILIVHTKSSSEQTFGKYRPDAALLGVWRGDNFSKVSPIVIVHTKLSSEQTFEKYRPYVALLGV